MARTLEGKVKDKIKRMLNKHGVWYFMPVLTGYGKHGLPDFVCCLNGHFVALECKAEDNRAPTALQQQRLNEIQAAGGTTMVVTPCVLGGLDDWLRRVTEKL